VPRGCNDRRRGRIVTFGIKPTGRPPTTATSGRPQAQRRRGARGRCFVEKPDAAKAAPTWRPVSLEQRNFMFRASVMLGEIERFEPAMATASRPRLPR